MAQKEQNFANHGRIDPSFHIFLFGVGLILLIATVIELVRHPDWLAIVRVIGVVWALVLMFKVRLYALKVQDRVIRLEERLRLEKLLPDSLKPKIEDLSEAQLIALRFASDKELPGLVEKTLAGNWDQKQIKQSIQLWRPDYWRV